MLLDKVDRLMGTGSINWMTFFACFFHIIFRRQNDGSPGSSVGRALDLQKVLFALILLYFPYLPFARDIKLRPCVMILIKFKEYFILEYIIHILSML